MYNALVLSHFNYCSTIWKDEHSKRHINELLKLQKRAARVITRDTYDVRSSENFEKLEWISIEKTLKNREIMMTFKALTGRSSKNIAELFSKCDNENYNLRSNNTKLSLKKRWMN